MHLTQSLIFVISIEYILSVSALFSSLCLFSWTRWSQFLKCLLRPFLYGTNNFPVLLDDWEYFMRNLVLDFIKVCSWRDFIPQKNSYWTLIIQSDTISNLILMLKNVVSFPILQHAIKYEGKHGDFLVYVVYKAVWILKDIFPDLFFIRRKGSLKPNLNFSGEQGN